MTEQRHDFMGGAMVLATAVAITKVMGALYKIPLGNLLDSQGMAHFYVAYNIYNFLLLLSTAGLPLALSRLVSQAQALGRGRQMRRVFRVALVLFSLLGLTFGCVLWYGSQPLANALHDSLAAPAIRALAPSVVCVCLLSAIRGYTQGQGRMTPTAASQIIESACKLAVGLPLAWWLLRQGAAPHQAAAGAIAGVSLGSVLALVSLGLYLLVTCHRCVTKDRPQPRFQIAGELLRIGVPITIGSVGMSALTLLDQLLVMDTLQTQLHLSQAAATARYGEYTFGMALFALPSSFIVPITVSLLPAITAARTRGQLQRTRETALRACRMTLLLALPTGIGLSVLAQPILTFLYPAVPQTAAAAAGHLSVLGIASVFVCLMLVSAGILQSCGREDIPVWALLGGGVVKIIVNRFLVGNPAIGIYGAPVGTLCCYAFIAAVHLLALRRVIPGWPGFAHLIFRPLLATLAMALTARGSWLFFTYELSLGRWAVLVAISFSAVLYGISALLLGTVGREDLRLLPKGEKIADFLKIDVTSP